MRTTSLPVQNSQGAEAARLQDMAAQAQQQAQREAQQAQRDLQQAQREAQQAQREAQRAIRDATRDMARGAREGRPMIAQFPPFPGGGPRIPEEAVIIAVAFFVMCAVIAIGFPIARAFGRRMDKRSASPSADPDTRARLERIEQAVDAIAVEVERISEGQRFQTRILTEGSAQALSVGQKMAEPVRLPDRADIRASRESA